MNFRSFVLTTIAIGLGVSIANGNLMSQVDNVATQLDPMMVDAYRLYDNNGDELGYVNCAQKKIKMDTWNSWATKEEIMTNVSHIPFGAFTAGLMYDVAEVNCQQQGYN